uniref:Cytochrome P450 n=1 Tax=Cercocebus atys TaxID=9531 RepID=A0A2K5M0G9_CERAT
MLASGPLLVALLVCLTVMVLMSVWQQRKSRGKLPLGPTPLPFIGNYLQLNTEQMCTSLMKISERYGPVFTLHLGPRRVVVLCGHDAVREALVDQAEEFSGRGEQATFNWVFKSYGVTFSTLERAKPLRHFSIATLRNFGEKAGFLIQAFLGTRGEINPTFFLSRTVSNVISSTFLSLLRMMRESFQFTATSTGQLHEMFSSVMKHLPGPQQQTFKELQGLDDFIAKKFIDSFLIRLQEEKNPNTEFYMKNLVMTALNLFIAGAKTVSTTLRYGFLLLTKHPEVEGKVHEEIDRVISKNRQPKFEDQARMPYTEAVIHEIQRFGDMLPMAVAHRVNKDTKFQDVFLLKKCSLCWALFFSNPQYFNPQQFKKSDAFVPFSIGKRPLFAARPLLTPAGASLTQLSFLWCSWYFPGFQVPVRIYPSVIS